MSRTKWIFSEDYHLVMKMDYEQIVVKLTQNLSAKRLEHSKGVSLTAGLLADRYGSDYHKARIAGLLHDCAREIPKNNLLSKAGSFGIVVDDVFIFEPLLLHAPLGAILAKNEYGIKDEEILDAVVKHTLGGPGLSLLAKIIYLADMIEPARVFPGVDKLRLLAEADLDSALLAAYDQSLSYLIGNNKLIHPLTIQGRNELLLNLRHN